MQAVIEDPALLPSEQDAVRAERFVAGTNGRLIVLLRDAHANLSAQKNIYKAAEFWARKTGIDLILSEAAWGEAGLGGAREALTPTALKRASDRLLWDNLITGHEYLTLVSDLPVRIVGIEDPRLYRRNWEVFRRMVTDREQVSAFLTRSHAAVDGMKRRDYPKELLDYESADTDTEDWIKKYQALRGLADGAGLRADVRTEKAFRSLGVLELMEAGLNTERLASEQEIAFGEARVQCGDCADRLAEAFKSAGPSVAALQSAVGQLARATGRDAWEASSELGRYQHYLEAVESIDYSELFTAVDTLEQSIYARLAGSREARATRFIDRHTRLLESAFALRLSPAEAHRLSSELREVRPVSWQAALNDRIIDQDRADDLLAYEPDLPTRLVAVRNFYRLAALRDKVFVRRSDEVLTESNKSAAVLITGGYHTDHLTELFAKRGYSVAVFTPFVTAETDQVAYEKTVLSSNPDHSALLALLVRFGGSDRLRAELPRMTGDTRVLAERLTRLGSPAGARMAGQQKRKHKKAARQKAEPVLTAKRVTTHLFREDQGVVFTDLAGAKSSIEVTVSDDPLRTTAAILTLRSNDISGHDLRAVHVLQSNGKHRRHARGPVKIVSFESPLWHQSLRAQLRYTIYPGDLVELPATLTGSRPIRLRYKRTKDLMGHSYFEFKRINEPDGPTAPTTKPGAGARMASSDRSADRTVRAANVLRDIVGSIHASIRRLGASNAAKADLPDDARIVAELERRIAEHPDLREELRGLLLIEASTSPAFERIEALAAFRYGLARAYAKKHDPSAMGRRRFVQLMFGSAAAAAASSVGLAPLAIQSGVQTAQAVQAARSHIVAFNEASAVQRMLQSMRHAHLGAGSPDALGRLISLGVGRFWDETKPERLASVRDESDGLLLGEGLHTVPGLQSGVVPSDYADFVQAHSMFQNLSADPKVEAFLRTVRAAGQALSGLSPAQQASRSDSLARLAARDGDVSLEELQTAIREAALDDEPPAAPQKPAIEEFLPPDRVGLFGLPTQFIFKAVDPATRENLVILMTFPKRAVLEQSPDNTSFAYYNVHVFPAPATDAPLPTDPAQIEAFKRAMVDDLMNRDGGMARHEADAGHLVIGTPGDGTKMVFDSSVGEQKFHLSGPSRTWVERPILEWFHERYGVMNDTRFTRSEMGARLASLPDAAVKSDTVVKELADALGLWAGGSETVRNFIEPSSGLEVYEIETVIDFDVDMPQGPGLLRQLFDFDWRGLGKKVMRFYVVCDERHLPIAIYPKEGQVPESIWRSDKAEMPDLDPVYYSRLNLISYLIPTHLLRDTGAGLSRKALWKEFSRLQRLRQRLSKFNDYYETLDQGIEGRSKSGDAIMVMLHRGSAPYSYVEWDDREHHPTILSFDERALSDRLRGLESYKRANYKSSDNLNRYDFFDRMFRPAERTRAIWVQYPWVYEFNRFLGVDSGFRREVYETMRLEAAARLRDGDAVADIGTGTGFSLWFAWIAAAAAKVRLRFFASDINPMAVANARTNFRLNGIPAEVIVSNVMVGNDGRTAFPVPIRFLLCNSPAHNGNPPAAAIDGPLAFRNTTTSTFHDGGEQAWRFWRRAFAQIADARLFDQRGGIALFWNKPGAHYAEDDPIVRHFKTIRSVASVESIPADNRRDESVGYTTYAVRTGREWGRIGRYLNRIKASTTAAFEILSRAVQNRPPKERGLYLRLAILYYMTLPTIAVAKFFPVMLLSATGHWKSALLTYYAGPIVRLGMMTYFAIRHRLPMSRAILFSLIPQVGTYLALPAQVLRGSDLLRAKMIGRVAADLRTAAETSAAPIRMRQTVQTRSLRLAEALVNWMEGHDGAAKWIVVGPGTDPKIIKRAVRAGQKVMMIGYQARGLNEFAGRAERMADGRELSYTPVTRLDMTLAAGSLVSDAPIDASRLIQPDLRESLGARMSQRVRSDKPLHWNLATATGSSSAVEAQLTDARFDGAVDAAYAVKAATGLRELSSAAIDPLAEYPEILRVLLDLRTGAVIRGDLDPAAVDAVRYLAATVNMMQARALTVKYARSPGTPKRGILLIYDREKLRFEAVKRGEDLANGGLYSENEEHLMSTDIGLDMAVIDGVLNGKGFFAEALKNSGADDAGSLQAAVDIANRVFGGDRIERKVPSPVTDLVFPTARSAERLESSLRSYLDSIRIFGRAYLTVWIFDDAQPAAAVQKAAMLERLAREYKTEIRYVGRQERADYEKLLQGSDPALRGPDAMDLLFKEGAYGSNRNRVQAYTGGRVYVTVDDDSYATTTPGAGLTTAVQQDHLVTTGSLLSNLLWDDRLPEAAHHEVDAMDDRMAHLQGTRDLWAFEKLSDDCLFEAAAMIRRVLPPDEAREVIVNAVQSAVYDRLLVASDGPGDQMSMSLRNYRSAVGWDEAAPVPVDVLGAYGRYLLKKPADASLLEAPPSDGDLIDLPLVVGTDGVVSFVGAYPNLNGAGSFQNHMGTFLAGGGLTSLRGNERFRFFSGAFLTVAAGDGAFTTTTATAVDNRHQGNLIPSGMIDSMPLIEAVRNGDRSRKSMLTRLSLDHRREPSPVRGVDANGRELTDDEARSIVEGYLRECAQAISSDVVEDKISADRAARRVISDVSYRYELLSDFSVYGDAEGRAAKKLAILFYPFVGGRGYFERVLSIVEAEAQRTRRARELSPKVQSATRQMERDGSLPFRTISGARMADVQTQLGPRYAAAIALIPDADKELSSHGLSISAVSERIAAGQPKARRSYVNAAPLRAEAIERHKDPIGPDLSDGFHRDTYLLTGDVVRSQLGRIIRSKVASASPRTLRILETGIGKDAVERDEIIALTVEALKAERQDPSQWTLDLLSMDVDPGFVERAGSRRPEPVGIPDSELPRLRIGAAVSDVYDPESVRSVVEPWLAGERADVIFARRINYMNTFAVLGWLIGRSDLSEPKILDAQRAIQAGMVFWNLLRVAGRPALDGVPGTIYVQETPNMTAYMPAQRRGPIGPPLVIPGGRLVAHPDQARHRWPSEIYPAIDQRVVMSGDLRPELSDLADPSGADPEGQRVRFEDSGVSEFVDASALDRGMLSWARHVLDEHDRFDREHDAELSAPTGARMATGKKPRDIEARMLKTFGAEDLGRLKELLGIRPGLDRIVSWNRSGQKFQTLLVRDDDGNFKRVVTKHVVTVLSSDGTKRKAAYFFKRWESPDGLDWVIRGTVNRQFGREVRAARTLHAAGLGPDAIKIKKGMIILEDPGTSIEDYFGDDQILAAEKIRLAGAVGEGLGRFHSLSRRDWLGRARFLTHNDLKYEWRQNEDGSTSSVEVLKDHMRVDPASTRVTFIDPGQIGYRSNKHRVDEMTMVRRVMAAWGADSSQSTMLNDAFDMAYKSAFAPPIAGESRGQALRAVLANWGWCLGFGGIAGFMAVAAISFDGGLILEYVRTTAIQGWALTLAVTMISLLRPGKKLLALSAAALTGMILYWKRQYLTSDVGVTLALTTGAVMASAFLSDIFWAMIKKRSVSLNGAPSQNISIRRAVISAAWWSLAATPVMRLYINLFWNPFIQHSGLDDFKDKYLFDLGIASTFVHVPLMVLLNLVYGELGSVGTDLLGNGWRNIHKSRPIRALLTIYPINSIYWMAVLPFVYKWGGNDQERLWIASSLAISVYTFFIKPVVGGMYRPDPKDFEAKPAAPAGARMADAAKRIDRAVAAHREEWFGRKITNGVMGRWAGLSKDRVRDMRVEKRLSAVTEKTILEHEAFAVSWVSPHRIVSAAQMLSRDGVAITPAALAQRMWEQTAWRKNPDRPGSVKQLAANLPHYIQNYSVKYPWLKERLQSLKDRTEHPHRGRPMNRERLELSPIRGRAVALLPKLDTLGRTAHDRSNRPIMEALIALIDSAAAVPAADPLPRISDSKVAARAGVSRQTLYNRLEDKVDGEALQVAFDAMLADYATVKERRDAHILEALFARLVRSGDPIDPSYPFLSAQTPLSIRTLQTLLTPGSLLSDKGRKNYELLKKRHATRLDRAISKAVSDLVRAQGPDARVTHIAIARQMRTNGFLGTKKSATLDSLKQSVTLRFRNDPGFRRALRDARAAERKARSVEVAAAGAGARLAVLLPRAATAADLANGRPHINKPEFFMDAQQTRRYPRQFAMTVRPASAGSRPLERVAVIARVNTGSMGIRLFVERDPLRPMAISLNPSTSRAPGFMSAPPQTGPSSVADRNLILKRLAPSLKGEEIRCAVHEVSGYWSRTISADPDQAYQGFLEALAAAMKSGANWRVRFTYKGISILSEAAPDDAGWSAQDRLRAETARHYLGGFQTEVFPSDAHVVGDLTESGAQKIASATNGLERLGWSGTVISRDEGVRVPTAALLLQLALSTKAALTEGDPAVDWLRYLTGNAALSAEDANLLREGKLQQMRLYGWRKYSIAPLAARMAEELGRALRTVFETGVSA